MTAAEARWRPDDDVHSIWEITLHVGGWAGEAARRLQGNAAGEPDEGDWPAPEVPDEQAWADAIQRVFNNRDLLFTAVRALTDEDLASTKRTSSDGNANPVTRAGLIEGIAQHNAYHAGQIGLLKKLMRSAS